MDKKFKIIILIIGIAVIYLSFFALASIAETINASQTLTALSTVVMLTELSALLWFIRRAFSFPLLVRRLLLYLQCLLAVGIIGLLIHLIVCFFNPHYT